MESFSIGINDEETKEKGDILDDEVPPCCQNISASKRKFGFYSWNCKRKHKSSQSQKNIWNRRNGTI